MAWRHVFVFLLLFVVLGLVDDVTTFIVVGNGWGVEVNWFTRWLMCVFGSPFLVWLVKTVIVVPFLVLYVYVYARFFGARLGAINMVVLLVFRVYPVIVNVYNIFSTATSISWD